MPILAVRLARIYIAPIPDSVMHVLRIGADAQVLHAIVTRIIIQVADHIKPPGPESDEGFRNHMGDLDTPFSAVFR